MYQYILIDLKNQASMAIITGMFIEMKYLNITIVGWQY